MKYCFVFVCQGGELEYKAALLAASLNYAVRCEHELVAAVPAGNNVAPLSDETQQLMNALGVRTVPIENPLAADYLIGYKLACLSVHTDAEKLIFLDSDILCIKEFHHQSRFEHAEFNAKLEDWHHHHIEDWNAIYDFFELPQADPCRSCRAPSDARGSCRSRGRRRGWRSPRPRTWPSP